MKRASAPLEPNSLGRWLSTSAGQAVFWIMPLARILMCGLWFVLLPTATQSAVYQPALYGALYLWIAWTAATTAAAIAGQPLQIGICRFVVVIDTVLAIISMATLRGEEGATIAFALCVTVFALGLRVGRKIAFTTFLIIPIALILRDTQLLFLPTTSTPSFIRSTASEIVIAALQIIAVFTLILWANRRYLLEKFSSEFSSLRMLSLERSFEFDLQVWTEALAMLYAPARAACIMAAPSKNTASRYYHLDLPDWINDKHRDELMAGFQQLPPGCSIFDCELNQVVPPGARTPRPFDETEQRIALILHRANISAALVQPMQIDRSRGGVVCAITRPVDAVKIAEAFHLGRHVTDMSDFLSRIATAERNFIADAHDVARRDLHDGVLQSLAALRMRLLLVAKRKDVVNTPVDLEIRKTVDILTLEQSRLRGFLEKSESGDHTVNLVSQLDICVRSISLQWDIDVALKSEEPAIPVDAESSFNIEHLIREVIANAVRHAKSKSLTVSLSLKQDALMIAVIDGNPLTEGGQGFEKPALTLKSASLRDRLRLVHGEAYVEGLGKGTLLSVRIPMQQVDDA
jgi:signal transduction histidine kinase